MKYMTQTEAARKQHQAAELMRRIGKDDEATRFDEMSLEEYAAGRGAQLTGGANPNRRRRPAMARRTNQAVNDVDDANDALDQIADLADEGLDPELTREEVVAKLKEIADVASGEDEEDEDDDEN